MAVKNTTPKAKPKVIVKRSWLRSFLLVVTISLSILSITALTAVQWVQTRVFDTNYWTQSMSQLLDNQEITTSLGRYVTNQLFDDEAVEARVQEALPERAAFLAPPLTTQLRSLTEEASIRVVQSDVFQNIWTTANRAAHQRVMEAARADQSAKPESQPRTFANVDLSEVRQRVRDRLGVASESMSAEQSDSPVGLQADLQTTKENIRRYVHASDFAYAILPALAAASVLGALAVARNRRRTLMYISMGTALFALLQLIGVRGVRPILLNRVQDASYQPAVGQFYDALVASFNSTVYSVLVLAVIVWVVTLMLGSSRLFVWMRKYLKTSKLRKTDYYAYWQEFRLIFAAYKLYIWAGFAVVALAALAFVVEVSWQSAINTLLVLVAFISLVQIIGSPPYYIKAKR